jgi:hypothetical protein
VLSLAEQALAFDGLLEATPLDDHGACWKRLGARALGYLQRGSRGVSGERGG